MFFQLLGFGRSACHLPLKEYPLVLLRIYVFLDTEARPSCPDLRFYNLTLHQEWDAREIELEGAAPIGSLLEWIDDIFETPVTPTDRTLGKWENVIYAENEFDSSAAGRMFFHASASQRLIR